MFDTIRLSTDQVQLDSAKLLQHGWKQTTSRGIDPHGLLQVSQALRLFRQGASPQFLQYSPGRSELKLETSLPKVLFGENVSLLAPDDVLYALDELANRIADLIGSQVPHVQDWDIRGRADAVYSWQVGNQVPDYLHAFMPMQLPRHYMITVNRDATLYWRNRLRVIRMYDKYAESGLAQAKGLLRFEVQMNRAKAELTKTAGVHSLKARDVLTWGNARAVLANYLDGLGADLVITSDEELFRLLCQRCGNTHAVRLMGFVFACRLYGRDELIRRGFRRNWFWRNAHQINKAGASIGSAKSGLLAPLTLPEVGDYTGAPGPLP